MNKKIIIGSRGSNLSLAYANKVKSLIIDVREKLSKLIGKEVSPEDFSVRKAKDNESLVCLDAKKYELNDNITIITCCDIPIAIAGVIGGLETSVTSTTTSIYLEAAVFDPVSVRKSSKEIGIRTESSSRFEKGISFRNTIDSVTRAINLIEKFDHKI